MNDEPIGKDKKCEHGYGPNGDCCCNCANQKKLMCHPMNGNNRSMGGILEDKIKFGKGSIMKQCGWVCTMFTHLEPESADNLIFYDFEHGMCEMHYPRKHFNK